MRSRRLWSTLLMAPVIEVGAGDDDLDMVIAKREHALGWGVICHECNVDPGLLGLGRSNLSDAELASVRAQPRARGRAGTGPKGPKGA